MAIPNAVTGFVIENPFTGKELDLSWNANLEVNIVGYNVYRSGGPALSEMIKLTPAPVPVLQFRDKTAEQKINTKYYYSITAVNASGQESVKTAPAEYTQGLLASGPMQYRLNAMVRRGNLGIGMTGELVY